MRGEFLCGAAGDEVRLAAAFGERGELRLQRRGMLAGGQAGIVEQPAGLRHFGLRTRQRGEEDAEVRLRLGYGFGQRAGVRIGLADLQRHAASDGRQPFVGAIAHRHQRGDLVGELAAVGVERSGNGGDRPFQTGGLGTHRLGGATESGRLAPAGAHGEQIDDADEGGDHRQRGDILGEGDRQQERKLVAGEPEHAADPGDGGGDRQRRRQPCRAARLDLDRLGPGERFAAVIVAVATHRFGRGRFQLVPAQGIVGGCGFRPHVDNHGTPVRVRRA